MASFDPAQLSENEDHNYSDPHLVEIGGAAHNSKNFKTNIIYSKVSNSGKEKYIGLKITNISDLKKATPRLKLPTLLSSSISKKTPVGTTVPEEIKQKLHNYCRTCAGLKVPLVDIFSEKGVQMRLSQQIQHLEDINEHESLSTQMCMDCICDMKMSYKFFMQIKKAEMKLKSICNSLSDSLSKSSEDSTEDQRKSNNEIDSLANESFSTITDSDLVDEIMNTNESKVDECCETNEICNDESELFEEFDPDNPHETNEKDMNKNKECEISGKENQHNYSYRYDESLNAYVKINPHEKTQKCVNKQEKVTNSDNINKIDSTNSENLNKIDSTNSENLNKIDSTNSENINKIDSTNMQNQLKRKLSGGNMNDETDNRSKKLSIGLKDLKLPKLNIHDATSIKTQEDGVMYVTTKGSKPNEMLLIKVKKMDKLVEKKGDKAKKKDSSMLHKIFSKYESSSRKGSYIDEQIEEYKKKRVQILGETAHITETDLEEEVRETRMAGQDDCNNTETCDQPHNGENQGNERTQTNVSKIISEVPASSSESALSSEKITHRWKSMKNSHAALNKDLAEDCSARLRSVLKQKDEYIREFVNYLKQRRIVVSRLRDEDIISLYEAKNNVILDREPVTVVYESEDIDPFEFKKSYECDFCDQSFSAREMEFEHSKIHDFKLMHYCEDCKQEFSTHKAKRSHNMECIQKLMCKYCEAVLESKGKKRQHEQKHCDELYGQLCDLCGEKFKHIGTLDQHVKSRHMQLEKIFKCPQCSKKFAFRTKLTFHIKTVHTTSRAYLCEDCGSDFKNPASLRHHRIRKHQPSNNKKECPECQKMIPVYSMSKHMHTHKAYSIHCPHCDKMFKNSSTLKQHLRIHEDQRQYKCDECGVGFNRRDGLRLHLKVHQKSDSRGLKECSCQICGEKFPNHSTLVIHRNRTHKDGRNYTCHICNRSMISVRSLEWHLANIHNETMPGVVRDDSSIDVETKRVSCYHCNKTFKTEMILRTHIKNSHVQKEPMKCLDCELTFTSEVRLKHHMMITHNRIEGTLECPHCPKRFVNQLRLKTHMISHSDERPYTCDECGFMLKTKIQLIKHKQNRHSNERPLQCKYCSWRCKQVSALVCHERTHTNERPYSCSVCKQRFKYLGDKNKHERRHEILGGTGFKRVVGGRNTSKINKKKEDDSTEQESDQEQEEYEIEETKEEFEEHIEGELDSFDDSQIVKFEDEEIITEESQASFEPVGFTITYY